MHAHDLLLRCYFEKDGDQWLGYCLDFMLVTQAGSLPEAMRKLESQMREYVYDATAGEDRKHADTLLRRRAPLRYWVKFYVAWIKQSMQHASRTRKAVKEPMPLVPACA